MFALRRPLQLVPTKTPKEIVARLSAEIVKTLGDPKVRERYAQNGLEPVGGTPEQFAALIRSEIPKYAKIVKASGAKVD